LLCPGCGAEVPDIEELRSDHLYVGAAPGCWAAYTELLGFQMSDPGLAGVHSLCVDVYMAQHPGVPGRQASQSVWVHLVGLCLSLEHGFDGPASARAKARLAGPDAAFTWLEPPASLGDVTVQDVISTARAGDSSAARRWADSVWQAWSPHRSEIRRRTTALLQSLG
jgi:hypothetical protein